LKLNKRFVGSTGESIACRFLKDKGYKIIEKNFRCRSGEIDIVAMDGEDLCFIEVKMRKSSSYGPPYLAVTPQKQKQISIAALNYLKKTTLKYSGIRFDVVSINLENSTEKIELFKGAFEGTF